MSKHHSKSEKRFICGTQRTPFLIADLSLARYDETAKIIMEKDMKTWLSVLTLCLAPNSHAFAQTDGGEVDREILARVKSRMLSEVADGKVAGAAHLISHDGKEVYFASAGLRDIETRKPFERDTILRFYSMSKPITSVAAMKLYEQGKFQLDDPVSKFIPAFKSTTVWEQRDSDGAVVAAEREIQVLDVFRHTTGFAYGGNGNSSLESKYVSVGMTYRPPAGMMPPDMTIEDAANALATIPALHHPGKQFTYGFSNRPSWKIDRSLVWKDSRRVPEVGDLRSVQDGRYRLLCSRREKGAICDLSHLA